MQFVEGRDLAEIIAQQPQSDIYALGATLYHLLTGAKPPDALARATALVSARPNPLKPANEIKEAVGVELAAILTRAMAQNPAERYATAAEFREAQRQIGRIDAADVEYSVHLSEIDSPVVGIGEAAIIRSARVSPTGSSALSGSSPTGAISGRIRSMIQPAMIRLTISIILNKPSD